MSSERRAFSVAIYARRGGVGGQVLVIKHRRLATWLPVGGELEAGETPLDMREFEKKTLTEIGMPPQMIMRHRIPGFGHIFSGDGYAAGYYSYIWAEVLVHDAWAAFTEAGSPYDKATSKRFRDTIMSVGNSVDPADAFRAFRGRDPKTDALLRVKGFPVPSGANN